MDRELIERVTQEVIAAMKPSADAAPRSARPPVRSFITADELRRRLGAGGLSLLELAANEHLTPAAQDYVNSRQISVSRKTEPAAMPPEVQTSRAVAPENLPIAVAGQMCAMYATGPVGMITAGGNEKVQAVLASLAREGLQFVDCSAGQCWLADFKNLCAGIAQGRLALGVAVLPYAADAMILANKIKGVRAVQGTGAASVHAAVRHVGANLLILEHAISTYHELRAMARTFVNDRKICGLAGDVLAAITDMERH